MSDLKSDTTGSAQREAPTSAEAGAFGFGDPRPLLGRESAEGGDAWVDGAVEAALPLHHHRTGRVELADDSAVAGPEVGAGVRNELDHCTDAHAGGDSRGEQTST